jgi:hypothetical protein
MGVVFQGGFVNWVMVSWLLFAVFLFEAAAIFFFGRTLAGQSKHDYITRRNHIGSVILLGSSILSAILFVEIELRPLMGRHYTTRHFFHFAFDALLVISLGGALATHPLKKARALQCQRLQWHHWFGRTTVIAIILVAISAMFLPLPKQIRTAIAFRTPTPALRQ